MPLITKPKDINRIWASGGDKVAPTAQKIAQGWIREIPPHQWFNYTDNKQDQAIAHINQMGIAQWDAETEYQAGKSLVQGPTNGVVYRATQTAVNKNPEVDSGFWEVAFLTSAPDYDNRYAKLPDNLSDIPNKSSARTNLGVYSKSEVFTKTEVNNLLATSVKQPIGEGQQWQKVIRSAGTLYTNTTGRAIAVSVRSIGYNTGVTLYCDETVISQNGQAGGEGNDWNSVFGIIPAGSIYRIANVRGSLTWMELS